MYMYVTFLGFSLLAGCDVDEGVCLALCEQWQGGGGWERQLCRLDM